MPRSTTLEPVPEGSTPPPVQPTNTKKGEKKTRTSLKNLNEAALAQKEQLQALETLIARQATRGHDVSHLLACLDRWETVVVQGQTSTPSRHASVKENLEWRLLQPGQPPIFPSFFSSYDLGFEEFAKLYLLHIGTRESPSEFAKPSCWPTAQKHGELLCLRPGDKEGLPLRIMHECFNDFERRMGMELPEPSPFTDGATRAAKLLCYSMGESYPNEDARQNEFDECVKELFNWKNGHYLATTSETTTGRADRVILVDECVPLVIREDKWEISKGEGDAYLQLARSYELVVKALLDDPNDPKKAAFLANGAPMFLVCVLGTQLFVNGGFYDGKSMMVEPLGRSAFFMLRDRSGGRQKALTVLLDALCQGVKKLTDIYHSALGGTFAVGTPRLYNRVNGSDLTILGPFAENEHERLIFSGMLSVPSDVEQIAVLVKIASDGYGVEVHRALAQRNMAPVYHGCCQPGVAPPAHVMEHLKKEDGWTSLFDFASTAPILKKAMRLLIKQSLDRILAELDVHGLVHGDLRTNNVMIHLDEQKKPIVTASNEVELKVVDFDWAGLAGEVRYPASLNNKDIIWPGKAGGPIEKGHDRWVVESWWKTFMV